MVKKFLPGILLLLISLGASAQDADEKQQLYVTDKLRLSLYYEAGGKGGTVELLASGDKLTIEEVNGAYALVTTSDGKVGWVKRGFLVLEPTSNLMLEEEKKRTESLVREIDKLKNSKVIIDQYEKDLNSMNENLQALISEKKKAETTIESLEQTLEKKTKQIETLSDYEAVPPEELLNTLAAVYWKHTLVIAVFIILISFFTGKQIIAAKVKRKFHGIKVW
ncbi:MAG: hypothetical protein IIB69_11650 [Proteobacteria bacterium]|nr:hypothetical protein [Pseudomonadota bacterium]